MIASPLLWRLAGAGIGALAVVGLIAWGMSAVYGAGFDAGELRGKLTLQEAVTVSEKSRADTLERLIALGKENARIEREAEAREAAALARGRVQIKTVERVIRENPSFAATVRPVDLDGVRDEQLADVAAAADRSAELSAASLRGVRATGAP